MQLICFLMACTSSAPALPTNVDWAGLTVVADLGAPPFPAPRWTLTGTPALVGRTSVVHDAVLTCVDCPTDCPSLPIGPLTLHNGQYQRPSDLPAIDQRIELSLSPGEGRIRMTRIIDTPIEAGTPLYWPADWSLELRVEDVITPAVRSGDVVWVPPSTMMQLEGGGPLPLGHTLTSELVTIYVGDLVHDVPATRTRLNVLPSGMHMELPIGQSTPGTDLLVSGVRFPESRSQDGIRILFDGSPDPALLTRLLNTQSQLPRPLWVVPGPRDAYIGRRLVLSEAARTSPIALAKALLHTQNLEPSLRDAMASRLGPLPPAEDPGCYGLHSRPDLDRGRLLAQLELHGPISATTWSELAATHPALEPWLRAPTLPRLRIVHEAGHLRVLDEGQTGLPIRVPVQIDGERRILTVGEVISVPLEASVVFDPVDTQPFHRG